MINIKFQIIGSEKNKDDAFGIIMDHQKREVKCLVDETYITDEPELIKLLKKKGIKLKEENVK